MSGRYGKTIGVVAILMTALAGCAQRADTYSYVPEHVQRTCQYEATKYSAPFDGSGGGIMYDVLVQLDREAQVYNACVRSKGY